MQKLRLIQSGKILLLAIIMFGGYNLFSQTLEDDEQEIIKDFEAQLEDAQRVVVKPTLQPVVVSKKTYKYDVTIIPLELKYPDPIIKPLAAEPDLPFESKSFYAKLGYGNIKNPKAIIKYYKSDQNKLDYYADITHYGLNNEKKLQNQSMSNTDATIGFNYRLKENTQLNFKANGIYDRRKNYFLLIEDKYIPKYRGYPIKKIQAGTQIELLNPEESASGLDYNIGVGYSILNLLSFENRNEFVPNLNAMVAKAIGNWKLTFPVKTFVTLQQDVDDLYGFSFDPSIKTNSERLWLKVGLSFFTDNQLKSKIWPSIHADYTLSGKNLHVFVSSDQKVVTNNLHQLTKINPWVYPYQSKLSNNVLQTISGGIKSESNFLGLEAELGYAKLFNQVSFVNSLLNFDLDRSDARLVDLNAVFLKANIDFALSDAITIGGNLVKNFYTKKLYGTPSLELKGYAKMKFFKDFIVLSPSLTIRDKSTALLPGRDINEKELNNQVDLSVNSEFNLSKKFALYIEANNILNNLYQPLYNYPVVGIHFNGGIVMKF